MHQRIDTLSHYAGPAVKTPVTVEAETVEAPAAAEESAAPSPKEKRPKSPNMLAKMKHMFGGSHDKKDKKCECSRSSAMPGDGKLTCHPAGLSSQERAS